MACVNGLDGSRNARSRCSRRYAHNSSTTGIDRAGRACRRFSVDASLQLASAFQSGAAQDEAPLLEALRDDDVPGAVPQEAFRASSATADEHEHVAAQKILTQMPDNQALQTGEALPYVNRFRPGEDVLWPIAEQAHRWMHRKRRMTPYGRSTTSSALRPSLTRRATSERTSSAMNFGFAEAAFRTLGRSGRSQ